MNRVLLIAQKEIKRKIILSLVVGIIFGSICALAGSFFWNRAPIVSFGIGVLILNFALFLLGADIISEEKSKETFSFLLTLPLRDIEIVFGKLLGMMLMMAPVILINAIIITFTSYSEGDLGLIFYYSLSLSLYLLISASLLLLASSQFQRLPQIFLVFATYHIILAIPGAYFLSNTAPTYGSFYSFLVFLIIVAFLTPFVFGITELITMGLPVSAPLILQTNGPGEILTIFENLPEDPAFTLVNIFSPLWHSSLLFLQGSEFFNTHSFSGFISIFFIILMVAIINLLASLRLRRNLLQLLKHILNLLDQ